MDEISKEEPNCSIFFTLIKVEVTFCGYPFNFLVRNVFNIGQCGVLGYFGCRIVEPNTKITFQPWSKGDFPIKH